MKRLIAAAIVCLWCSPLLAAGWLPLAESVVAPCDIAAAAGTLCVAAHSVTRRMWSGYGGPLFQITRASDSTTQNVGFTATGLVNQASITTFCAATTCTYSIIYDQMHTAASGNNLPQATAANQAPVTYTTFSNGVTLPMVATLPGQFYRNRASTVGIPSGNNSISEYYVVNTFTFSPCCGTFGDMEATVADNGAGHMFALGFGTGGPQAGTGVGPWPGIDWENGFYTFGATPTAILLANFARYNSGTDIYSLKSDPGLSGTLTLQHSGAPPATPNLEGGLSIGEGGDGTPAPTGFFEGIVIAGATSDATDNAIAANVAKFYGGSGAPTQPAPIVETYVGGGGFAGTTSVALVPTAPIPAGSLILIYARPRVQSSATDTVTDTQGNIYIQAADQCVGFANNNVGCATTGNLNVFFAFNAKPLSISDTITYNSAGATFIFADVTYFNGILTSSNPLDAGTVQSNFAVSGQVSITSGTPLASNELVFGYGTCATSAPTTQTNGWQGAFGNSNNLATIRVPAIETITYNPTGCVGAPGAVIMGFKHQ